MRGDERWEKHWVGMPEFEQEDDPNYKELLVKFKTKKTMTSFRS